MEDVAGRLRSLPSVDEVVSRLESRYPHRLLVAETRRAIAAMRDEIRAGRDVDTSDSAARVEEALRQLDRPSLRRVINATGVVLHTNLGRAPLPAVDFISGYSNLEYDLATGRRGRRDTHVSALFECLFERPAIVVNNNAAAVFLTLNELAAGGEAVVSRGELIEIGDGFRIPEIMARSGASIREIGTTNRTRLDDYREAMTPATRVILRVHPSNFRISGFTEKPSLRELAGLAHERGIPLYEDLGSGCLVDLKPYGIDEPLVSDSIEAGVDIVTFSGDKLLGGPQAGVVAGDAGLIARIRRNPIFRAMRAGRLIYQALETTLRAIVFDRLNEIPALAMLMQSAETIRARAARFLASIEAVKGELIPGESVAGGGSTPGQSIPTWLIAIEGHATEVERKLRLGDPPVIARIEDDRLVLDLRTVLPDEEDLLAKLLSFALR